MASTSQQPREPEVPASGAIFTFGKSKFAENAPSKFWIKRDQITAISCGDEHTAVVTSTGRLFTFGSNEFGQLGLGHNDNVLKPSCVKVLKPDKVVAVACGKSHTVVAMASGRLWAFGSNSEGQLGIGREETAESVNVPTLVQFSYDMEAVVELEAGNSHTLALGQTGAVYVWGSNKEGQLGLGAEGEESLFVPTKLVAFMESVGPCKSISCGYYHSAVISDQGGLYTFGEADGGKLGLGDPSKEADVPTLVDLGPSEAEGDEGQREVYQMAIQVADGMAYLSNVPEPKIIHRDLAARNCMVNGRLVVKIGDFGLARDLCYAQDYYRMHGKDWMPVRWMAPESLVDNVFSQASDVWAYGVVLWELVTLAEQPYQGLSNEEVLNYVRNGNTMEIPTNTPEIIASLMRDCWRFEATDRPTFIDICHRLLEHSHPDFQRDSFITSALCRRVLQQREGILASGDDDLPIEDAELAPLQSNGNGEVRALDNGHAVQLPLGQLGPHAGHSDSMRDFDISPRAHNMWERLRKILRNRLPHSNNTTAAQASTAASAATAPPPTSVEA